MLLEAILKGIITVAGRRTLDSHTMKIVSTVIRSLGKEYDFLKHITIPDAVYTEEGQQLTVNASINTVDAKKIGKVIEAILRDTYIGLGGEGGVYFINELKNVIGEQNVGELVSLGINLDRLQSEQHERYKQLEKEKEEIKKEKKEKKEKPTTRERHLDYTWEDVSSWDYDNNVISLFKTDGSVLDMLYLDALVEDYVHRYSKYEEVLEEATQTVRLSEKEYEFLETLYSRDMDMNLATGLLSISKDELDTIVQKLLSLEMLQHVSHREVKLTQKGILFLLEKLERDGRVVK